ncbi:MAG TPA: D-glycerate dehydrogenase [Rhodothermales bacterium]|nr:D-glycerate dehydrogenase [Rhodothermales bacterium]
MPKVAVTRPLPEAGLVALREAFEVEIYDPVEQGEADEDRLIELARDAEALIPTVADPITEKVLATSSHLRIVAQFGVGTDNIDLEAARQHDIIVTNTPDVLTDATADFAFALLLSVGRHLPQAQEVVRTGRFVRWETQMLLGVELRGKTLGIVGFGRIGRAMARRALGFGMNVIYHNRHRANPTHERTLGARYVSFEGLLAESDVISLHCALNEDSRHLFDAAAFEQMKPSALLINTARGPVVDENALVEALAQNQIAGAGLDVFEQEPKVHPGLLKQSRVVVAPHLGSATTEARTAMARMASEAVLAAFDEVPKIPYRVA